MADPFSVAGSAVGVTSLGIQTCQALFRYYSQFKGFHDDIDDVLGRVEGLQGILNSLKLLKGRFEADNHKPSSQLHLALKECEEVLLRLKKLADKCNATVAPGSLEDRLRYAKKRATWPFKKETLEGLQTTLDRFQHNLSLALQSAGLDTLVQRVQELWPALNTLRDKTTGIEHHLTEHTSTLQYLGSDITSSFMRQEDNSMTVLHELLDLRNEVSRHTTVVQQGLNTLMFSDGRIRDPSLVPPPQLAEASQTLREVTPQFQSTLLQYETQISQTTSRANLGSLQPLCRCRQKKKQSAKRRAWMTWFSEEVYHHQPECPQFSHGDYSRSSAAQFMVYSRMVGLYVQVGWQCSRNRGWNSIAPMLRYRAVVPHDAPAFELISNTTFEVLLNAVIQRDSSVILPNTLSGLQSIFGKNASPTDLDQHGMGIADNAMRLLCVLWGEGFDDEDAICKFFDALIAQGVPLEGMDNWIEIASRPYSRDGSGKLDASILSISRYIIRRLGYWRVPWWDGRFRESWFAVGSLHAIANILATEELNDGFDEDDCVLRAILRRSVAEFRYHITTEKAIIPKLVLDRYVLALASWSDGLEMLILNGIYNANDELGIALWEQAVRLAYLPSIELLLQQQIEVSLDDWNRIIENSRLSRELFDWDLNRKVLSTMAARLLPRNCESPEDISDNESDEDTTALMICSLYHAYRLPAYAAEIAWSEGHRNVDEATYMPIEFSDPYPRHFGTPLWNHTTSSGYKDREICLLWKWFLEKSADPFWTHPSLLTTPAHCVISTFIALAARDSSLEPLNEMHSFFVAKQTDRCTCYCSRGGCYVISCAVSRYWWRRGLLQFHRKSILPHLFSFVDENCHAEWMSSAIIRRMTFEKLSLTHTCCYRVWEEVRGWFDRPTPEEAKSIYEIEHNEIKLLDDLVAEFERSWTTYTKPFAKFMKKVWKPRMRDVLQEQQVDKEVYQAELRRMGVVIDKPKKRDGSDSESESDASEESEESIESEESTESEGSGWYTTDDEAEVEYDHTGSGNDYDGMDEDESGNAGQRDDGA